MRTKITNLTPAQIAAFHEQLRLEDVRAQLLRAKLPGIIARAEAKRAAVIADAYARAQARYATRQAIRKTIRPFQLPLKGLEAA